MAPPQNEKIGRGKNISYNITCSKEAFDRLRSDDRFFAVLTLARVVNALHFCQKAATDAKAVSGPVSGGTSLNSFLVAASILYEGLITIERIGVLFKDFDSYKNGLANLLRDRKFQALKKNYLGRMRNKFVFHFDKEVAKESLNHLELPVYTFASGIGKATDEVYFRLADEAFMNYLLQPQDKESVENVRDRYKEIVQDTNQLMVQFIESTARFLADITIDMGFTLVVADNGQH